MSYENLISQSGFNTSPLNNYTSSVTFKSSHDSEDISSDNDTKFSDFMDSLKESDDSSKETEIKTDSGNDNSSDKTNDSLSSADEATNSDNDVATTENTNDTTTGATSSSNEENNSTTNTSDETQNSETQHSTTGNTAQHNEGRVSSSPEITTQTQNSDPQIDQIEEYTSDTPATEHITLTKHMSQIEALIPANFSDLTSDDLAELKEKIDTYLSNNLTTEEQEAITELIAAQYLSIMQPTPEQTTVTITGKQQNPDMLTLSNMSSITNSDINTVNKTALPVSSVPNSNSSGETNNADTTKIPNSIIGNDISIEGGEDGTIMTTTRNSNPFGDTIEDAGRGDIMRTKAQSTSAPTQQNSNNTNTNGNLTQTNAEQQTLTTKSETTSTIIAQQDLIGTDSPILLQTQNVSSANTLSSTSAQASTAGQTHPASQMVSITMQKAIQNGESTTIKLQLNPPELGRVEVKMSIDKDNTAKIVLTAERAETHQMLQRDSQFLERAMSDAGLDAEGNLSFELASDEQAFEQKDSSGTSSDSTSSEDADTDDEDSIIDQASTMDWYVDPNTGRMHYSVLA
ncbi:MAG: flagellar hook-length control protein FliK [Alphaproteobacteria bacterium]|nr:flagellar hook-length control protein FliK [Alphaproteobacteria bacterium]